MRRVFLFYVDPGRFFSIDFYPILSYLISLAIETCSDNIFSFACRKALPPAIDVPAMTQSIDLNPPALVV
jgi:hypothetical protein